MKIPKVRFIKSVSDTRNKPSPAYPEIALVGRSNVGKSSLINSLFNRRHLAKTSSTPGKTRLINYFLINEQLYLVDLPGYGYTKISPKSTRHWEKLITGYLLNNDNLCMVLVLIDARHSLMKLDQLMISWLQKYAISFGLVLTKSDKLAKSKLIGQIEIFEKAVPGCPLVIYSAKSHTGREELWQLINSLVYIDV